MSSGLSKPSPAFSASHRETPGSKKRTSDEEVSIFRSLSSGWKRFSKNPCVSSNTRYIICLARLLNFSLSAGISPHMISVLKAQMYMILLVVSQLRGHLSTYGRTTGKDVMFGSCRLGGRAKNDADEHDPGRPQRVYFGMKIYRRKRMDRCFARRLLAGPF